MVSVVRNIITLGISLLDCIDSNLDRLNEKIYNKIYEAAKDLVKTGEEISREFGIPIVNKRISVTPIALVGGSACKTAPAAAMDIMTAKVDKEIRNGANRAMNCDMANVNKTIDAALEQKNAIQRLQENGRLERLPEKLRQTALLRLQYPEMSLSQLAEKCDPPVTKSCMNHRMRKLLEEAKKL